MCVCVCPNGFFRRLSTFCLITTTNLFQTGSRLGPPAKGKRVNLRHVDEQEGDVREEVAAPHRVCVVEDGTLVISGREFYLESEGFLQVIHIYTYRKQLE
ncbi:hypothetical protein EVAR_100332_1 [Eumeta japonica]|uniref:Uncharacterized protein n=1 Tax=Eumeta variegata TaxID=151549 RepID=A0A4C2A824_EUMVA|nr:hypothetical protein EVAR_100332_1 [Eumeta japonica]